MKPGTTNTILLRSDGQRFRERVGFAVLVVIGVYYVFRILVEFKGILEPFLWAVIFVMSFGPVVNSLEQVLVNLIYQVLTFTSNAFVASSLSVRFSRFFGGVKRGQFPSRLPANPPSDKSAPSFEVTSELDNLGQPGNSTGTFQRRNYWSDDLLEDDDFPLMTADTSNAGNNNSPTKGELSTTTTMHTYNRTTRTCDSDDKSKRSTFAPSILWTIRYVAKISSLIIVVGSLCTLVSIFFFLVLQSARNMRDHWDVYQKGSENLRRTITEFFHSAVANLGKAAEGADTSFGTSSESANSLSNMTRVFLRSTGMNRVNYDHITHELLETTQDIVYALLGDLLNNVGNLLMSSAISCLYVMFWLLFDLKSDDPSKVQDSKSQEEDEYYVDNHSQNVEILENPLTNNKEYQIGSMGSSNIGSSISGGSSSMTRAVISNQIPSNGDLEQGDAFGIMGNNLSNVKRLNANQQHPPGELHLNQIQNQNQSRGMMQSQMQSQEPTKQQGQAGNSGNRHDASTIGAGGVGEEQDLISAFVQSDRTQPREEMYETESTFEDTESLFGDTSVLDQSFFGAPSEVGDFAIDIQPGNLQDIPLNDNLEAPIVNVCHNDVDKTGIIPVSRIRRRKKSTTAMNQFHVMFRRYMLLKTFSCLGFGISVAVLLTWLQIDLAAAFGAITFVMNYVPEVGPIIAMVLPCPIILLDSRLERPFFTLFLALMGQGFLKFAFGNIIEVALIESDKKLKTHPVAILLSVAIWGHVWGPTGMLLSVPLMAFIKISILSDMVPASYRDPILILLEGDRDAPKRHALQ